MREIKNLEECEIFMKQYSEFKRLNLEYRKIFEKKEKEYTMEQLEDKLGEKIKIIK